MRPKKTPPCTSKKALRFILPDFLFKHSRLLADVLANKRIPKAGTAHSPKEEFIFDRAAIDEHELVRGSARAVGR